MSRSRPIRLLPVALVALLALLALPGPALAAKPTFHDKIDDTFEDVVCGIPVTVHFEGVQTGTFVFDADGNVVEAKITGSGTFTLTTADGNSVTVKFAGQYRLESVTVDPVTGFVTFVETYRGLPEKISAKGQGTLLRDAGLITIQTTLDFSTDPPTLVDRQILVNKGPHPEAESDFTLGCEIVIEQLT